MLYSSDFEARTVRLTRFEPFLSFFSILRYILILFFRKIIDIAALVNLFSTGEGEGEGEVAFFSAKRWDRRNRADLIESATPCHDAQVVGLYRDSNPLRLTILAAMSEDYTTAPQHLQGQSSMRNSSVLSLYVKMNESLIFTIGASWQGVAESIRSSLLLRS